VGVLLGVPPLGVARPLRGVPGVWFGVGVRVGVGVKENVDAASVTDAGVTALMEEETEEEMRLPVLLLSPTTSWSGWWFWCCWCCCWARARARALLGSSGCRVVVAVVGLRCTTLQAKPTVLSTMMTMLQAGHASDMPWSCPVPGRGLSRLIGRPGPWLGRLVVLVMRSSHPRSIASGWAGLGCWAALSCLALPCVVLRCACCCCCCLTPVSLPVATEAPWSVDVFWSRLFLLLRCFGSLTTTASPLAAAQCRRWGLRCQTFGPRLTHRSCSRCR
jgi:hypothetical protein